MKTTKTLLISIALIAFTGFASAGRYNNDAVYADVVDVQPVYENVRVPQNRKVCNNKRRNRHHSSQRSSGGGAILGGIIGGLIGNRFGKGSGRDAATAAGILAGAAIGSNSKHNRRHYNNRRQCYTQRDYYEEQRLVGYDVSYEYIGRIYHTRLNNHPGDRVRINVNVQVAEY